MVWGSTRPMLRNVSEVQEKEVSDLSDAKTIEGSAQGNWIVGGLSPPDNIVPSEGMGPSEATAPSEGMGPSEVNGEVID